MDSVVRVGEGDGARVSTGRRETPRDVCHCPGQVPGWGGHRCVLIPGGWAWAGLSGTMGLMAVRERELGKPPSFPVGILT